ncbi:sensor histidine kinase [Luteibacter sp.]|uniref:sensor histidine kinase n=1 Tax=Luteibacter sp. TaxID=1886636 RepID=UPI002806F59A|nr:sensor histidine kinase [Luteibacter sp.]MDQ8048084.1 sensor histidine kinase [Luteibacter sp.]
MATRKRPAGRGGEEQKEAHFHISSALFEELGERLVSKPEVALAELIKNAYDADAGNCHLSISDAQIVVADSGHGMTEDVFLKSWMVVSGQAKGELRFSRTYGRSMAGSKGVGRFSARFLGNILDVESVAWDPSLRRKTRLKTSFNWASISRSESIEEVIIDYTTAVVEDAVPTGTVLTIRELRNNAASASTWTIKTDVLKLTDPSSGLEPPPFKWKSNAASRGEVTDPGFRVTFDEDEGEDEDEALPVDVAASILKSYVGRIRLEVSEDGKVAYTVYWKGSERPVEKKSFSLSKLVKPYGAKVLRSEAEDSEVDARGLPVELEKVQNLPLATRLNSPVFIDLRFFPRRRGTFADLPVNGLKAQGWLGARASFAVVDNNFAMANYADAASDWLGIDASKATNERRWQSVLTEALYPMDEEDRKSTSRNPMLALPRGRQLMGRIHVATKKLPVGREDESDEWLQPNMDRESLRSNGAFRLLWHVARFAVEVLAVHDRNHRLEELEAEERERQLAARTALSSAISEFESAPDIEPEVRTRIAERLRTAEEHIRQSEEYNRESRVSLELMAMMGVMAGFMTHEFDKAIVGLQKSSAVLKKLSKKFPELAEPARTISTSEEKLGEFIEYMRVFVKSARNPQPVEFKSKAQVSFALSSLLSIAEAHQVTVEVDIDSKLPGPFMPVAAYNGIVVNLVSNAFKAMVGKVPGAARKVRIYATNDASRHTLVVADTGIGIPEYLRSRIWDPLFTTTDNDEDNPLGTGLGLGLSVVRRVVSEMKGRVELMNPPPTGFETAFRVSLPLARE